jgi:hypothetical protein
LLKEPESAAAAADGQSFKHEERGRRIGLDVASSGGGADSPSAALPAASDVWDVARAVWEQQTARGRGTGGASAGAADTVSASLAVAAEHLKLASAVSHALAVARARSEDRLQPQHFPLSQQQPLQQQPQHRGRLRAADVPAHIRLVRVAVAGVQTVAPAALAPTSSLSAGGGGSIARSSLRGVHAIAIARAAIRVLCYALPALCPVPPALPPPLSLGYPGVARGVLSAVDTDTVLAGWRVLQWLVPPDGPCGERLMSVLRLYDFGEGGSASGVGAMQNEVGAAARNDASVITSRYSSPDAVSQRRPSFHATPAGISADAAAAERGVRWRASMMSPRAVSYELRVAAAGLAEQALP